MTPAEWIDHYDNLVYFFMDKVNGWIVAITVVIFIILPVHHKPLREKMLYFLNICLIGFLLLLFRIFTHRAFGW